MLDAPGIEDDFYLNLLDWSSSNRLAIALKNEIYIQNVATNNIELLVSEDQKFSGEGATSLSWHKDGATLAVGKRNGTVEIWDTERMQILQQYYKHKDRVSALAWNGE